MSEGKSSAAADTIISNVMSAHASNCFLLGDCDAKIYPLIISD
jgi:hypothetical protein